MTTVEFSDEFDVLYNNIKSQSAPGLDGYEKSLFLTLAQEELVEKAYRGQNIFRESFEETEFLRRNLDKLVKQIVIDSTTELDPEDKITEHSVFFEIPQDLMFITFDELTVSKEGCQDTKKLSITPITQDEYILQKSNPFRQPEITLRSSRAWRLDYGNHTSRTIEIVPPKDVTVDSYKVRYIKRPRAIIVENIASLGLTIRGLNAVTQCELDDVIHRHILNRAVELAKIHYEAGDPSSILQNNRIEI